MNKPISLRIKQREIRNIEPATKPMHKHPWKTFMLTP